MTFNAQKYRCTLYSEAIALLKRLKRSDHIRVQMIATIKSFIMQLSFVEKVFESSLIFEFLILKHDFAGKMTKEFRKCSALLYQDT